MRWYGYMTETEYKKETEEGLRMALYLMLMNVWGIVVGILIAIECSL